MITATRGQFFSEEYTISDGDQTVASFHPTSWWSVNGTFNLMSEVLCVHRSGFHTFFLERRNSVLAEATRRRFGSEVRVRFGEILCELRPAPDFLGETAIRADRAVCGKVRRKLD